MKIKIPFSHYSLLIEITSESKRCILPIGSDCHPAYMLSKVGLRSISLPFDWLEVKPAFALNYVKANLEDRFDCFLKNLKINNANKIYAEKYPEALFYHYDNLIQNIELQGKIKNRTRRFLEFHDSMDCCFLLSLPSYCVSTREDVEFIKKSIVDFGGVLKENDELVIYLRFDNSFDENKENSTILEEFVSTLPQIKLFKYIRYLNDFGIWGNESEYLPFTRKMGLTTTATGFKLSISKFR